MSFVALLYKKIVDFLLSFNAFHFFFSLLDFGVESTTKVGISVIN